MKRSRFLIVIILLIVLALGAVGVVVGMFLGAHPIQILKTIVQETSVQGRFDFFRSAQDLTATSTALQA